MRFPLQLSFKVLAFAPQIAVRDAQGQLLLYVKQKLFKLKEKVHVFADEAQQRELYRIGADRIIDWSAQYDIARADGTRLGAIKRRGARSLWKAHYDILQDGRESHAIREENAWVKVLDGVLGEIPVVGMFTGYFFNPAYLVTRTDGTVVLRIQKRPAFFEGRYEITERASGDERERELLVLSAVMMLLLERTRG